VRRVLTFGVVWLVAAVTATAVAWQGVRLVGDQVTDDRPPSLTAEEVAAATATGAGSPAPGATTTTTAPASPVTTAAPPEAPAAAGEAVTRTYALTGGSTSLRFTPGGVTVVFATPAPGYQVRSEPADGGGWRVEFDGPSGRSRVEGWWDGGPQDRVEDDGADSGGGAAATADGP